MQSLNKILSKVLDLDENQINDELGPHNTENWDSFNALLLMTELEKNFKANFSIEEVSAVKNVGDIKRILKRYGKNFE